MCIRQKGFNRFCQGGFTVIEVMIAITILAIGLLGIASMQMNAIRGNSLSDNITCALALAEDKMEELMGLDYSDPALEDSVYENNDNLIEVAKGQVDKQEALIDETGKLNAGHFRRVWNIADDTPIDDNKTVTVIVLWDKERHQVSLTSVKRK
ncbi:MAG: prepilin-type N-terminal cleavage/methylation domain-containing protein [Desulfatiglans sp.]|jgi:type IV pilus assembly protein PilV|nr:prepilin-type N-terminal cleavage/methylation domain-containing protein [Desulfatiglans sp.]